MGGWRKGECVICTRGEWLCAGRPREAGRSGGQREQRRIVDVNFYRLLGSEGSSCRAGGQRPAAGLPCVSSECTMMLRLQQGKNWLWLACRGKSLGARVKERCERSLSTS